MDEDEIFDEFTAPKNIRNAVGKYAKGKSGAEKNCLWKVGKMESATKIQKYLYPVVNYGVRGLLILILFGMCLQSMFSTSFIGVITNEDGSVQDRTLNIADSPFRHLLVFALCIIALVLLKRAWQYAKRQSLFCRLPVKITVSGVLKAFYIITGIAGCVWILITQLRPGSDPAKIYTIAMQWRERNFSAFAEGGYLFRYPYQAGIVLFYYFLSFFFGTDNFIALQLVNVAALVLVYYYLAKLSVVFWKEDKKIQTAVYIGLAVWLPLFFYITYLYGILIGMAFSLAAVYLSLRYLETRKIRYMVAAALCVGFATVFKMNCLIYMVAICCYLVYDIIVTSKWKNRLLSLLFIILMIIGFKGLNQAVYSYVEHLSGYETPEGEVMLSWVVMGLEDTPLGPGGYSGYIGDVFLEYHYDTEKITAASAERIREIMTDMSQNWYEKGLPFFAGKNAFQWNDPTFIGLHLSRNRLSAITLSDSVQSILEGKGSVRLSVFLNYAQTLILFGALCCLIVRFRSRDLAELFGGVIFLGGYLFHFFWESSSSYTIPYFVILIPYAVKGLFDIARKAEAAYGTLESNIRENGWSGVHNSLQNSLRKADIIAIVLLIAIVILVSAFSRTNLFSNTIALNDGEAAREQFYQGKRTGREELPDGYYTISPYLAEELTLAQREDGIEVISAGNGMSCKISIVIKNDNAILRFRDSERVLAALPEESYRLTAYLDDGMNMFYDGSVKAYQEWNLLAADGGGYCIVMNGLALTYDADMNQVRLETYDGRDAQRWAIRNSY